MAISQTRPRPHSRGPAGHGDDGVRGNELLTGLTGTVLIVVLAALGLTIVRIGQLIWLHLFLGLLLIGPLLVKLGATGYRFAGYYLGRRAYLRRGPPLPALRLLAIPVVGLTLLVMASGIVLLLGGTSTRSTWLLIHKASFIVWLVVTAIHVLAHVTESAGAVRAELLPDGRHRVRAVRGRNARLLVIATGLAAGVIIALIAIPDFGAWSHYMATHHHHHG
jgi:uncharacterized membrane protein YbhN (UPF0104 family)